MSRRGGALLLGGIVIVVIVAVVLLSSGGGSSGTSTGTGTGASTTASTGAHTTSTSTSGTKSSSTTGSKASVTNQITLTPPEPSSKSIGIAEILAEGTQHAIYVAAEHIPPTHGFFYVLWLYNSPSSAQAIGKTTVNSTARMQAGALLPANAGDYHQLLLTREDRRTTFAARPDGPLLGRVQPHQIEPSRKRSRNADRNRKRRRRQPDAAAGYGLPTQLNRLTATAFPGSWSRPGRAPSSTP